MSQISPRDVAYTLLHLWHVSPLLSCLSCDLDHLADACILVASQRPYTAHSTDLYLPLCTVALLTSRPSDTHRKCHYLPTAIFSTFSPDIITQQQAFNYPRAQIISFIVFAVYFYNLLISSQVKNNNCFGLLSYMWFLYFGCIVWD